MKVDGIREEKRVRYFIDGRGYSSLYAVCRKLAVEEYKDLVWGPGRELAQEAVQEALDGFGDIQTEEDERKFRELKKMALSKAAAVHFPHDDSCKTPYSPCRQYFDGDFRYPSCKVKIDQWISNRTKQLMARYKAVRALRSKK